MQKWYTSPVEPLNGPKYSTRPLTSPYSLTINKDRFICHRTCPRSSFSSRLLCRLRGAWQRFMIYWYICERWGVRKVAVSNLHSKSNLSSFTNGMGQCSMTSFTWDHLKRRRYTENFCFDCILLVLDKCCIYYCAITPFINIPFLPLYHLRRYDEPINLSFPLFQFPPIPLSPHCYHSFPQSVPRRQSQDARLDRPPLPLHDPHNCALQFPSAHQQRCRPGRLATRPPQGWYLLQWIPRWCEQYHHQMWLDAIYCTIYLACCSWKSVGLQDRWVVCLFLWSLFSPSLSHSMTWDLGKEEEYRKRRGDDCNHDADMIWRETV